MNRSTWIDIAVAGFLAAAGVVLWRWSERPSAELAGDIMVHPQCGACQMFSRVGFDPAMSERANQIYHRLRVEIELLGGHEPELWTEVVKYLVLDLDSQATRGLHLEEFDLVRRWAAQAAVAMYGRAFDEQRLAYRAALIDVVHTLPDRSAIAIRQVIASCATTASGGAPSGVYGVVRGCS